MFASILGFLNTAWLAVYNWLVALLNSMGAAAYILGIIFAMFAVRFLIYPFLKGGVGASDPVKRINRRRSLDE